MGFFGRGARAEKAESYNTVSIAERDWHDENGYNLQPFLGAYGSWPGFGVTATSSMEISAIYACLKILGEDMGSLPFALHRRSADGRETQHATEHRIYPILRYLANEAQSSGEFVEALTATAALAGDSFAMIEGFNGGRRIALRTLDETETLVPVRTVRKRVMYDYSDRGMTPRTLGLHQVFHLRGFTFNTVHGDRILERARQVIGIGGAAQQYAGTWLKKDIASGMFFEHPGFLGPEGVEAVLKAWHNKQGAGNAGEPSVLQDDMKAKRLDPDFQKQQLMETRKFVIEEAARIWRIPLHKLAHLDRMSFNNVEQMSLDYITTTLAPWRRRWKEAVHRHLLNRSEQLQALLYAEHNVEAMLRGDFKTQADGFRAMLEKGVYSINEVRKWLNLNPVEHGDEHYVQLNMQSIADHAAAIQELAGQDNGATEEGDEENGNR